MEYLHVAVNYNPVYKRSCLYLYVCLHELSAAKKTATIKGVKFNNSLALYKPISELDMGFFSFCVHTPRS